MLSEDIDAVRATASKYLCQSNIQFWIYVFLNVHRQGSGSTSLSALQETGRREAGFDKVP
jgi:hypothetical protein